MSRLRELREAHGLSQERLAELVKPKTSQPQIGRLEKKPGETGYRKMTVNWAQRLAPHLGDCNPLYLLGLSDDVEKPSGDAENLPKKQILKDSVTKESYINPAARKGAADQEGKEVDQEAVLTAIGRLAVELESVKAKLKQVEARGDANPKKAQRK